MADSIDRVFAHALQTVRKIPRSGSARPPASDRLKLYGLYKQSMEGDVEGVMERPSLLPPSKDSELTREEKAEVEKWDAWSSCAGLSRSQAKCRYIDALISTMHTYAYGTPEARELVNELEFVWDQVKSNAAFTTSNSDDDSGKSAAGMTANTRRTYIDELLSEGRTKEGLRVLRPMSDQDEEDARRDLTPPPQQDGTAEEDDDEAPAHTPPARGSGWQSRVDRALVQMTAEIAALREVVEARGRRVWGTRATRQGWISWMMGRLWSLVTRVLVDTLVVAAIFVVLKYRAGGPEEVVRLWIEAKARLRRKLRASFDVPGG